MSSNGGIGGLVTVVWVWEGLEKAVGIVTVTLLGIFAHLEPFGWLRDVVLVYIFMAGMGKRCYLLA